MSLKKLQNDFLAAFVDGKLSEQFLQHIKSSQDLSDSDRLSIYQDSITEGLANALRELYPVCERLVGEDFFSGLAYEYIKRTPSLSPNLFNYGDCFPMFVLDFEATKELLYLPDVCCLEWALHGAYYAESQKPLDVDLLSKLGDEEKNALVLTLPPGSTLIASTYPIYHIWQANQSESNDETVSLDEGEDRLLVWRNDLDVCIDSLSENEWILLEAIEQRKNLGDISSLLTENMSIDEFTELLSHAAERGWVGGWVLAN